MPNEHSGLKLLGSIIHKDIETFANNDATPSVADGNIFKTATGHTSARNVTRLDDADQGQIVVILGANNTYKTTIVDGLTMKINGDWVEAAETTITLIFEGTNWYEISRR